MFAQLKEKRLLEQKQKLQDHQLPLAKGFCNNCSPSPVSRYQPQPSINDSATIVVPRGVSRGRGSRRDVIITNPFAQNKRNDENRSPFNGKTVIKEPTIIPCKVDSSKDRLKKTEINRKDSFREKSPDSKRYTRQPFQTKKIYNPQGFICDQSVILVQPKSPMAEDDFLDVQEAKLKQEKSFINSSYLSRHPSIHSNARTILLDWMMQICSFYNLFRETYYTAVNIVDTYLSLTSQMPRSQFQLLGVVSIFLASKLEEYEPQPVEELSHATSYAFSQEVILKMEEQVILTLKFRIRSCTFTFWTDLFIRKWMSFDHRLSCQLFNPEVFYRILYAVIDASQLDIDSLKFKPRHIVASLLLLAVCFFTEDLDIEEIQHSLPFSSKYLVDSTNHTVSQFRRFLDIRFGMKTIELTESVQFISSYFFCFRQNLETEQFSHTLQNFNKGNPRLVECRNNFIAQSRISY